jgi:hypothetical protein
MPQWRTCTAMKANTTCVFNSRLEEVAEASDGRPLCGP